MSKKYKYEHDYNKMIDRYEKMDLRYYLGQLKEHLNKVTQNELTVGVFILHFEDILSFRFKTEEEIRHINSDFRTSIDTSYQLWLLYHTMFSYSFEVIRQSEITVEEFTNNIKIILDDLWDDRLREPLRKFFTKKTSFSTDFSTMFQKYIFLSLLFNKVDKIPDFTLDEVTIMCNETIEKRLWYARTILYGLVKRKKEVTTYIKNMQNKSHEYNEILIRYFEVISNNDSQYINEQYKKLCDILDHYDKIEKFSTNELFNFEKWGYTKLAEHFGFEMQNIPDNAKLIYQPDEK
jgi:hypothetical protein